MSQLACPPLTQTPRIHTHIPVELLPCLFIDLISWSSYSQLPLHRDTSGELLQAFSQGWCLTVQYTIEFHTLALTSGWNETSITVAYQKGLHVDLTTELSCFGDSVDLNSFFHVLFWLDHLLQEC